MILLQQIYTIIKNRPLTFKLGLFSHFESACGFVNVKLVTVDLWAGGVGGLGRGAVQHLPSELITV